MSDTETEAPLEEEMSDEEKAMMAEWEAMAEEGESSGGGDSSDDDMAVGVLAAIEASGRDDIQFVLGGAGMKEMIKRVMDNDSMIPADVTYPPSMIATAIELTAIAMTSTAPVSGTFTIGSVLVTPENAEQYYFPDSPF